MIVAAFDLADVLAERPGLGEVQGRALDGLRLAHGDQAGVGGQVVVGMERQFVPQDVAHAAVGQFPIGVVGEVHDRGLVGGCRILHPQLVVVGQG